MTFYSKGSTEFKVIYYIRFVIQQTLKRLQQRTVHRPIDLSSDFFRFVTEVKGIS